MQIYINILIILYTIEREGVGGRWEKANKNSPPWEKLLCLTILCAFNDVSMKNNCNVVLENIICKLKQNYTLLYNYFC